MLSKQNRLKKKKEIEKVMRFGRAQAGEFLFLKWVKNGLEAPRFCFVVSKKVSKRAVQRNKVKRRLREAVKIFLPQIKEKVDVAVFAKPEILPKEFSQIKDEIQKLLAKQKLI